MQKVITFALMFLLSISSYAADWEKIYEDSNMTVRVDKASIVQKDRYIKSWFLFDYHDEQITKYTLKKYSSIKQLTYYDCPLKTSNSINLYFYSSELGTGEAVDTSIYQLKEADFSDIVPDSIGESMFDYVCQYRNKLKKNK